MTTWKRFSLRRCKPIDGSASPSEAGGLRHSDDQVELLEQVVNLIRMHAPDAAIAFNSTPATTYDAAARWLR